MRTGAADVSLVVDALDNERVLARRLPVNVDGDGGLERDLAVQPLQQFVTFNTDGNFVVGRELARRREPGHVVVDGLRHAVHAFDVALAQRGRNVLARGSGNWDGVRSAGEAGWIRNRRRRHVAANPRRRGAAENDRRGTSAAERRRSVAGSMVTTVG